MTYFILWYVLITLLGWISFPLIFHLTPALADRGFSFSRILGLLFWGFAFWFMASLGIVKNDLGGLLLGLMIMIGLGAWAIKITSLHSITSWLKENKATVISIEVLFFISFCCWTIVRAANPEILGTEKPMELAFINSIIRSPQFPPRDPWLSGYAISYYYFGYVITAMIAKLTATQGSIAFNLALSQTFALVAVAAFGIIFNLLSVVKTQSDEFDNKHKQNLFISLLGPAFILIVSNLEGFLEMLHARGILWYQDQAGQLSSSFWSWLDLKELSQPPSLPFSWMPSRYLWWWRASRIIQDYDLAGNWREVIDEFPYFSFLLGDLHPHVLAMPFALLAVGLSLNMFLGGAAGNTRWLWLKLKIHSKSFWTAAIVLGGLAFLNTWDFPIYVGLFSLVYCSWGLFLRHNKTQSPVQSEENRNELPETKGSSEISKIVSDFLSMAFSLGISGVLLYIPFYIGFSSQAGGILPNLVYSTRGAHLWIMFGSLLLPIFSYLIFIKLTRRNGLDLGKGFLISLGLLLLLWVISLGFGLGIASIPLLGNLFVSSIGGDGGASLFMESISRRISRLGWVTITLLLSFVFGYLINVIRSRRKTDREPNLNSDLEGKATDVSPQSFQISVNEFVFILILMGGLLVLFVEFFFLRDQFGSRMNTIFKFFYQTWIFWGLSAAFATAVLLRRLKGVWDILFRILIVLLLFSALVYPLTSIWGKTNGFEPTNGYTLDGIAYIERNNPEEMAAIRWVENAQDGIVVEAVGPQYSEYARVATISGQPNVLGWAGHESQWRGGREEIGTREEDIEFIYSSNDWEQTKLLLDLYNVRYIFIGDLERRTYRVNESKFQRFLGEPVFRSGQIMVFEVPREINFTELN